MLLHRAMRTSRGVISKAWRSLCDSTMPDHDGQLGPLLDYVLSQTYHHSNSHVTNLVATLQQLLQTRPHTSPGHCGPLSVPESMIHEFTSYYSSLAEDRKHRLFLFLATHLGVNHANVVGGAQRLLDSQNKDNDEGVLTCEDQLRMSLRPLYIDLLSLVTRSRGGLQLLVEMRSDLLSIIRALPSSCNKDYKILHELDCRLQELLSRWFSLGFLDLQQITWQSSCEMVEKVSQYEAVHRMRHWRDMKSRVGSYRRVFVYTHRNMPHLPVVILHCALTGDPSDNVETLLKRTTSDEQVENSGCINTAVFYSISAVYKGLSGIDLGNSLIKTVVQELMKEFPHLKQFVTLSPIPGFRQWLHDTISSTHYNSTEDELPSVDELLRLYPRCTNHSSALQQALRDVKIWSVDSSGDLARFLRKPLLSMCARYLVQEKKQQYAANPVAHFHLKNGASIWRLNWLANVSRTGLNQSYGIMVNYRYDLMKIGTNNSQYMLKGSIACSDNIRALLL